jgi:hypothetical protein
MAIWIFYALVWKSTRYEQVLRVTESLLLTLTEAYTHLHTYTHTHTHTIFFTFPLPELSIDHVTDYLWES